MKRRVKIVEAARGAAALYVLIGHVFWTAHELIGYSGPFFRLFRYGHEAVILFFLISGFSIHYTYVDRSLNSVSDLKKYYFARLRRIYPIFLVAFAMTLGLSALQRLTLGSGSLVAQDSSFTSIIAHLLFLTDLPGDGTWFTVHPGNAALWSLSYEVAYYLIYPLFWKVSKLAGPRTVLGIAIAFSLAHELLVALGYANHISKVFGYYWMWCVGAIAAQFVLQGCRVPVRHALFLTVLASGLCAIALLDNFPVRRLNDWLWGTVWSLFFLSYLGVYTSRSPLQATLGASTIILFAAGVAATGVVPGSRFLLFAKLGAVVMLCIFLSTELERRVRFLSTVIFRPFYPFGSVSYALYAIHLPIVLFTADLSYVLGFHPLWALASVPIILGIAHFMETASHRVSRSLSWTGVGNPALMGRAM